MSEWIKWILLGIAIVSIIGMIMALPFVQYINLGELGNLIGELVGIISGALVSARGLINNFLTPFGRTILDGILIYLFGKWFITLTIKITSWIYHFIFK